VLGLIINPVAGLGGRVGLKGSDGEAIQRRARELGARSPSPERAQAALTRLLPMRGGLELVTSPDEMGEQVARSLGFEPTVIGAIPQGATTAEDTVAAAQEMARRGVMLILFAGGDGTARDIVRAVGGECPALGIPAGVKILSAAFATNPRAAGDLARAYMEGTTARLREVEVLDLDEEAYRAGRVSPRLYGYLRAPYDRRRLQARKSPSGPDERGVLQAIAADVVDRMRPGVAYVIGPGTTTRPILERMGLDKTLVGVDVVCDRGLLAKDANEAMLLDILETHPGEIIVTPIGGQGYLLGRGNQPISPAVVEAVGRENIAVVSTPEKLHALRGQPLLVDSGDDETDRRLSGYVRVITGYRECSVYRVVSSI
jgi:predicted polyphosphate/ATP-dependent NAD kinase